MPNGDDSDDGARRELREAREQLSSRIDGTNTRIDSTNGRIDALNDEMHNRFDDVAARLDRMAQAQTRGFTAVLDEIRHQTDRLDRRIDNVLVGALGRVVRDHDDAIHDLQRRVTRLEGAGDR